MLLRPPSSQRSLLWLLLLLLGCPPQAVQAAPAPDLSPQEKMPPLRVIVTSNQDGPPLADSDLTLREALELLNGTRSLTQLSPVERTQVEILPATDRSRVEFRLLPRQTTIRLLTELPPLMRPGVILDGKTQPQSSAPESPAAPQGMSVPRPQVWLTVATPNSISRGLTVMANEITIRGLGFYGFTVPHDHTVSTLSASILVIAGQRLAILRPLPLIPDPQPPRQILIEDNWIGTGSALPDRQLASTFGVVVFDGPDTTIRHNWIAYNQGSGILTGAVAERLAIADNYLVGNGSMGMPDAIRLEGNINQAQIRHNLIRHNAGSAIFLFKPEGSVLIAKNVMDQNGDRFRRAAIYLMGNHHDVQENQICHQPGPGIVVAAYPLSLDNRLQNNRFVGLEGLSIDLVARHDVGVRDYQVGDGFNPPRDTPNRRQDSGNGNVNAPKFLSPDFFWREGQVNIDGIADPHAVVDFYQVLENGSDYGPLSAPLATVTADEQGRFGLTLTTLKPGDRISAIATDPNYGTSEPAANAVIRDLLSPSTFSPNATVYQAVGVQASPMTQDMNQDRCGFSSLSSPSSPQSMDGNSSNYIHIGHL